MRQGLREPFAVALVAVILAAGMWPGKPPIANQVAWSRGAGLRFEGAAQALAERPISVDGGELTLELWLEDEPPSAPGNLEIVSLIDAPGVHGLKMGRFPSGWILGGRRDNPTGDPKEDLYLVDARGGGARHLAITVDRDGAALHVSGAERVLHLPSTLAVPGEGFGGLIVLGATEGRASSWSGTVRALALHARALDEAELAHRATLGWPRGSKPGEVDPSFDGESIAHAPSSRDLISLHTFSEGKGALARNRVEGAPDLMLPEHVTNPLGPGLLAGPAQLRWLPSDVALNIAGFVPLGAALAWHRGRRGLWLALAAGISLSFGIEVAQVWIPGRSSSLIDLLCNGLGAGLGGWISALCPRAS